MYLSCDKNCTCVLICRLAFANNSLKVIRICLNDSLSRLSYPRLVQNKIYIFWYLFKVYLSLLPVLYGELLCPPTPLTKQYYALSLSMKISQWGREDVCSENFTGPVQFESHSPKWWGLSKFSFQQLGIEKLHSLFYLLKLSIFSSVNL